MSGAKSAMKSGGKNAATGDASFASTLDKARGTSTTSGMTAKAETTAIDAGFVDRSRVMATDATGAAAASSRAQSVALYRRLNAVEAP